MADCTVKKMATFIVRTWCGGLFSKQDGGLRNQKDGNFYSKQNGGLYVLSTVQYCKKHGKMAEYM